MKKKAIRLGAGAGMLVMTMPILLAHGNKPGSSSASIGGGEVKVDFVGPSANGRDVLSLLPPGGYWRMGADKATTLTTDVDLKVGEATVPKGTYTLVAYFSEDKEWSLVVADGVGSGSKPTKIVAQVPGIVSKTDAVVENMTIKLEANGSAGKLVLEWGTARLTAEFSAA
ncbi:MAG TPA: DUF2911 domain-containing protein [Vicinamibacteria bacterium]|nr:DUF2911 domain-containing protein [Vicinamibacteria bacterium]